MKYQVLLKLQLSPRSVASSSLCWAHLAVYRMPEESIPWRPPKWTQPFCSSRVQQGCEAVFEGVVYGVPHPTISWSWRGKPLDDWAGKARLGKVTKYDEKSGKVTLVIENLGPGDEGQYECRADNPYGDSTCTIAVSTAL